MIFTLVRYNTTLGRGVKLNTPTSSYCRGQENVDLYTHSSIGLHGTVLNYSSTGKSLLFIFLFCLLGTTLTLTLRSPVVLYIPHL
jgi:hypothetical protein